MATVTFENVFKKFGDLTIIENLSFTIRDKEFVVIVGPSGCGKSTSLRMIAGLEDITDGVIRIGDRIINDVLPKDRDIAMVFQNYALYPHMNVYKNMAFGLMLRKVSPAEIDRRVKIAADILGIENLLMRKPKQLSGGQRQRVAVGRAIVREPSVFLFDEPLSNLDAKMRVQMRSEIRKLHHQLQATMVYVTHDQVEAMTMGDRIVILKDGILQQEGPPLEIYKKPANVFVAGFIGSPAMNFIKGSIEIDNSHFGKFTADGISLAIPASTMNRFSKSIHAEVILGIRPEDFLIAENSSHSSDSGTVSGTVELVEATGSETLLHLKSNTHSMVARLGPDIHAKESDGVTVGFPFSRIHLFDSSSNRSLLLN